MKTQRSLLMTVRCDPKTRFEMMRSKDFFTVTELQFVQLINVKRDWCVLQHVSWSEKFEFQSVRSESVELALKTTECARLFTDC